MRKRVIPSEARNLALKTDELRDSSSPSASRNDIREESFSNLLEEGMLLI